MEEIIYYNISNHKKKNNDNFWNFLFFTGYLTKVKELSGKELEETHYVICSHTGNKKPYIVTVCMTSHSLIIYFANSLIHSNFIV